MPGKMCFLFCTPQVQLWIDLFLLLLFSTLYFPPHNIRLLEMHTKSSIKICTVAITFPRGRTQERRVKDFHSNCRSGWEDRATDNWLEIVKFIAINIYNLIHNGIAPNQVLIWELRYFPVLFIWPDHRVWASNPMLTVFAQ